MQISIVLRVLSMVLAAAVVPTNATEEKVAAKDCHQHGDDVNCHIDLSSVELSSADVVKVAPPNAIQVEYECVRQEGGTANPNAWYVHTRVLANHRHRRAFVFLSDHNPSFPKARGMRKRHVGCEHCLAQRQSR